MSTETNAKTKRLVQLAVTTALATNALTGCTGKVAPTHAYSAEKAEVAMAKGKSSKAVEHAEAAVLASPRDAYTRTLLGNAYLEEGRFLSAATTFAEALELGDTSPRTAISLTLAQTGSGDRAAAIETLRRFEAAIDPADFGLAIALAGRPEEGIHVLGNALRRGQNTAKIRQNLAYAYAMQGNWKAARLMVAEDVPADKVGQRIAEWAIMMAPEQFQTRVANLLDVEIARDPGQPAQLALANHPDVEMLAAEATEVRESAGPKSDFVFAAELPAASGTKTASDQAEASFAEASINPDRKAIRFVSNEVSQALPTRTKKPIPKTKTVKPASPASSGTSFAKGDYNVQLGSFSSMSEAHNAWKTFQARYPQLSGAERVITKARVNGKIYYRVAAAGFAKSSAATMCRTVKGKGGGCIAHASSRPLPGSLGVVNDDVRVAAR